METTMKRILTHTRSYPTLAASALLLLLVGGFCCLTVGGPVAVAQDAPPAVKVRTPAIPQVSPELWKEFSDAIQRSAHYQTVRAMSREAVAPIVANVTVGFQTELVMANYLQRMIDYSDYRAMLKDGVYANLGFGEIEDTEGETMEQPCFQLTVLDENSGDERRYIVPGDLASTYRIEFVDCVRILHPLNHRIQHGNYSGLLVNACREVCEAAGLEFVIGSTSQGDVVNATLRNRSVAEVITSLTHTCGWEVEVLGVRGIEDGMSLTFAAVQKGYEEHHLYPPTLNQDVSTDDIQDVLRSREYTNAVENPVTKITDHATALAHALKQAGTAIRRIRPVIQIRKYS